MSGPITNHTFGNMQHAEYEAKARKHQAPKRERTINFKFNIWNPLSALIQKINKPPTSVPASKLEAKNI